MEKKLLMRNIFLYFFYVLWFLACESPKEANDKEREAKDSARANDCSKKDREHCLEGCYFNEVVKQCDDQNNLRFSDVTATNFELLGRTTNGYLYNKRTQTRFATLNNRKVLAFDAYGSNLCTVDDDNNLRRHPAL
jgi:hypothetical protein